MSFEFLHKHAVTFLRVAIGFVFVWMGLLKLFNVSPVQGAVADAIPGLGSSQVLLFAAAFFELLIGAAFLANKFVKVAAITMSIHLTILTVGILITQGFAPRFPVLSLVGEHALKNLILIAAGLVLLSEKDDKHHRPSEHVPQHHQPQHPQHESSEQLSS
jgi:uncharacterized membrane protein YkgB